MNLSHRPVLALGLACFAGTLAAQTETASSSFYWADYDADGLKDALVVTSTGEVRLLAGTGHGLLEDVTSATGLDGLEECRFAFWFDYDGDLELDLLVATRTGPGRLFAQEAGFFADVSFEVGFAHEGPVLFGEAIDFDHDGAVDLHVHTAEGDFLYHNSADGSFVPIVLDFPRGSVQQGGSPASVDVESPDQRSEVEGPASGAPTGPVADGAQLPGRNPVRSRGGAEPRRERASVGSAVGLGLFEELSAPCAFSLEDQAGGSGCLSASSVPTLGMLYPLTSDLFVDVDGRVGVGTTSPAARLDVRTSSSEIPVRADGLSGPTRGYLAISGTPNFDGVTSANWSGFDVGVAGISVGPGLPGNFGVLGHADHAGVRGEYSSDPSGTFGELGVNGGIGVRARGSVLAAHLIGDVEVGNGVIRVVDGDLRMAATTGPGSVLLQPDAGDGAARLQMEGDTGAVTIELDAHNGSGSTLEMFSDAGDPRVLLDSEFGVQGVGALHLRNSDDLVVVQVDAGSDDDGGKVNLRASDGSLTVVLDGEADNGGGLIAVANDSSETTIELIGDSGDDSGEILMYDRMAGTNSIALRARDSFGTGGELVMVASTGNTTVRLDADNNGGALTLSEDDGSIACDLVGTVYSFRDASGTATWSFNRQTGTDSAVVDTPSFGQLEVYGMRATENWFEDFGSAMLIDGTAYVEIDPKFLELVTIDDTHPMKVFVSVNGETRGVWVRKGTSGFTVVERDGGSSTVSFDYRVVAKRRGLEATRLARHVDTLREEAALLDPGHAAPAPATTANWQGRAR